MIIVVQRVVRGRVANKCKLAKRQVSIVRANQIVHLNGGLFAYGEWAKPVLEHPNTQASVELRWLAARVCRHV